MNKKEQVQEVIAQAGKAVTNAQKAQILMNALPYIKQYSGKTIVVKYGGNAMLNENLKKAVMGDIVLLSLIGVKVVLVHGKRWQDGDTEAMVDDLAYFSFEPGAKWHAAFGYKRTGMDYSGYCLCFLFAYTTA